MSAKDTKRLPEDFRVYFDLTKKCMKLVLNMFNCMCVIFAPFAINEF